MPRRSGTVLFLLVMAVGIVWGHGNSGAQAPPVVLVGRVTDGSTGAPVTAALIRIAGTRWGAIADSSGWYRLQYSGTDSVLAICTTQPGYETRYERVVIPTRLTNAAGRIEPDTLNIELEPTRRLPASSRCR
jgi:hypothetical protein